MLEFQPASQVSAQMKLSLTLQANRFGPRLEEIPELRGLRGVRVRYPSRYGVRLRLCTITVGTKEVCYTRHLAVRIYRR